MVLLLDIVECPAQVVFAAKHSLRFTETTRCHVNGLAKMTDEVATNIRRAALRAVQQRYGALNSGGCQGCSEWCAKCARVDRGLLAVRRVNDGALAQARTGDHCHCAAFSMCVLASRDRRGIKFQIGLVAVACISRANATAPRNPPVQLCAHDCDRKIQCPTCTQQAVL